MSRYTSRNYDSGLSSSRYSSTPSRSYTGSSYSSGSYSSGSRSFDTGRYGNSSVSGTGRYGSSSYSSDLTSTSSSRYGSSGLGSTSSAYTSSRTSIPKTDELSSRRGSRSSLSSDISLDTKDSGFGDSIRRSSLRTSDKSDYLGTRRPSYKDDILDSTSYRSSAYSSRFSDRDKSDSETDKYRSSRRPSLREASSLESSKDVDTSRSDYRRFSNPNNENKSDYRRYSNPNNDLSVPSVYKQSSLEKPDGRYSSNISPASVRKYSATVDKVDDNTSSYSYRRSLRKQEEENKQKELNGSQSPSTQRLSSRTRRELERTGTESNDSDTSTKLSSRRIVDEPTGYESFTDRQRRRRESLESNNTDNEVSLDKTRWRSFASDTIKEVDKSLSDSNNKIVSEIPSGGSKTPEEADKSLSYKQVRSVDETSSSFTKPDNVFTSDLSNSVTKTGDSSVRGEVTRTEKDAEAQITSKSDATEAKPSGTTKAAEDDTESRAERIAKYKEQRRKQLQNMGAKIESHSDSDKMDSKKTNESESSQTTSKTESQTLSNRKSSRSSPKPEIETKESLQLSEKSIESCKASEETKPVTKKLPSLPLSNSTTTKTHSRKSLESDLVSADLPSKVVPVESKTLPSTTSESSRPSQDLRNSSGKRKSPSVERVILSNTENGRKSPITASSKTDRASPLRSTTKTDVVSASKASLPTKKVSSPSTLPKFEKPSSRVTSSPSRTVPTMDRKSPSLDRITTTTQSTAKTKTAATGGLSSNKQGSSVTKARTPSPKTTPTEPQNKQKIPETKPARVRTRLPSPSKTIKTDSPQTKSMKSNQSPIVKVTTTKSAANASVRVENKKPIRNVPSPKVEDGLKHSRKTVSERMAKTSRKQSSGNYTSDDEDVPKRSHPPRSPAVRRAKLGASNSPTGRRKLPDVTKVSKSKSKNTKSITKDADKSPVTKTRSGRSPSPVKSPRSLKVPDSPANLDNLLKDNLDYLSDDSTINTPSPVKKSDSKRKSPTNQTASPAQTLFKNGTSKEYVDESLLISSEYLKVKGNNSSLTGSKAGNDSDDEEFNTAPSTPLVPKKTLPEGEKKKNEGEEQEMKNGQSNQSSTGLSSRTDDPIRHRRGNNFNQLLQKFSSSEISSSERSESESSSRVTGRSSLNKHSGSISSSDESNTDRQTPERSHSFKLRTVKEDDVATNVPKRSSSFKSDFMRKRYEVDKPPEEEFVSVLQSRSKITDKSDSSSLSKYENLDKVKPVTSPVEEIIVDKELSAVLKSRRKETDEKVEKDQNSNNSSTHITKPYQDAFISDSLLQSKSRIYNIDSSLAELSKVTEELDKPETTISKAYLSDTEFGQITTQRRKSSSASLSDAVQYIKDVESSISSRISETISKHQDEKKNSRETSPLDQIKTQQHSSQILANTSQKQDIRNIRHISPDTKIASLESKTVISRDIASLETKTVVPRDIASLESKTVIPRDIASLESKTVVPRDIASLETKTVVPRGIEIVDDKPKSFVLSETLEIKNVTLEESSTDDLSENVSTEILSSAQNKMADNSKSGVSISPAIIIDKQSIRNSRENDAKLHDINKSKMSTTVSGDSVETESRRVIVLEEKTEICTPNIKDEENSSQPCLIQSDLSLESVKRVEPIHSAKNSSLVTSTVPSDSESVVSETKYPLQKDSLPLPSEKYLDVSESTILTSSDRSRDISDNSADDHVTRKQKSTGLSRSESLKTPGVKRTESFERRKGILKRTPSLPKQSTVPIVDEQLARILEQRKKQVDTEDSPEEEKPGSRRLSVTDEIAEIMKREKQNKPDQQEDEEDEEFNASVSERIFKMQTKIEEEKFAATPRSRSGIATPKSPFRIRSGAVTPKKQMSLEDSLPGKDDVLSSEKLFERLTTLAEDGKVETIQERRRKLEESQEKHRQSQRIKRENWRRRTQPITLEEITEADSLGTVSTFRALVRKKATTTMFEHLEQKPKLPVHVKKSEFPEHIQPKKRRSRSERYQTTPVTAAELLCIPEHETMESETLRHKFMCRSRQDSKADSGILSGSDFDNISATSDSLRSLTLDMDLGEDDTSRLSVSAKTSFFKQIEEKTTKDRYKGSASGAKRYIDRKKRERYLTQPITEEEVKSAAEMNDEPKQANIPQPEVVNRSKSLDIPDDKEENDELTRLSLKDKVRLFAEKKEEEKPPPKQNAPLPRRRNRKQTSRFSTQPVTIEEVEKAAKISPLLMSLVKPPDPEILKGLSLKAQRELAASHAEQTLSQTSSRPNSRAGSQPGSRRASFSEDNVPSVQVSHAKSEGDLQKSPGILRKKEILQSSPDLEIRSILKSETEKQESEPRGILKRADTIETSKPSEDTKSILKHCDISLSPDHDRRHGSQEVETKSIFRTIEIESCEVVLPGEGKDSSTNNAETPGILKKESSLEPKVAEPEKSSIRSREIRNDTSPVKSILKKDDREEGREASPPDSTTKRRSRHSDRYLTQPAEVTPEKSPQSRRKYKYDARHRTQPITPDELKKAGQVSPEIMKGGSVADRLNALKKSGDEEWKKRVAPKCLDFDSPQEIKLREKKCLTENRPISLSDRLSQLDVNKTTWKNRVEESDASKFTVAGKINKTVGTVQSPLVKRLKNKREGMVIDLGSKDNSPSESPVTTPTLERIPLPKDIISHASSTSSSTTSTTTKTTSEQTQTSSITESVTTVEIPQIASNDVDSFFLQFDENPEKIDVDIDDFNDIFINSNDILPSVKKIRPVRNRPVKGTNPMKRISVEVRSEYTEVTTGLAEKELKRLKTEKIAKDVGFAEEALAGLASKENFSKVALRKTDVTSTPGNKDRLDPFKDVMLLHVKGRRNVQTRLVSPTSLSINSGDCYVLVTPEKIINWVGTFSNVIEKAKAADITSFIHTKRDMGCRSGTTVATIEEEKQRLGAGKHFWATLGGQQEYQAVGPEEEDEIYETLINKTNIVYKLTDNSLLPYQEYWGAILKYDMLHPELTLVFDFGSELYLWLGKKVSPEDRKVGRILSQQLWEKGYDYSSCDINPLCPLHTEETGSVPIKSNTRPDWALFGKVHQGMETILFKEKFFDWPDTARIIKVKGQDADAEKKVELAELQAYDVSKMVPVNETPVTLVLEGSNVGRGTKWLEDMQGFIRQTDIITCGVNVWHVMEYDHYKLPETSYGQFHEGDTYVVRWQYMVSNAGLKSLKGQAARNTLTGRERCAYFFWQGSESTINEKGASALMTVELDEERGPQVRVIQGKEPPCFLNLFNGSMMVHIGKREEEESNTQGPWRLYCVRNEYENELMLLEINLCIDNLRSRSSFVLLNVKTGQLIIWNGCKSPEHTRQQARCAADKLKTHCPLEVGLHEDASIMISEMEEGEEKAQFWGAVGSRDRTLYMSLLDSERTLEHSVRLFYMTSVSGIFEVTERLNPCRSDEFYTPFPFLQSDLYKVSQPALFLVDNYYEVYLWQGWWPEGNEEEGNVHTGSAHSRFNVDRKCALQTTINYCKASRSQMPNMYIVCAGVEPQQFTNIFPYWEVDETAKELNMKDGKCQDYLESAEEMLSKLSRTQYSLEELQERPLPEGVDASKLESYLDEETFESILHMTKEEFYKLPSWKQRQLKQPTGLF